MKLKLLPLSETNRILEQAANVLDQLPTLESYGLVLLPHTFTDPTTIESVYVNKLLTKLYASDNAHEVFLASIINAAFTSGRLVFSGSNPSLSQLIRTDPYVSSEFKAKHVTTGSSLKPEIKENVFMAFRLKTLPSYYKVLKTPVKGNTSVFVLNHEYLLRAIAAQFEWDQATFDETFEHQYENCFQYSMVKKADRKVEANRGMAIVEPPKNPTSNAKKIDPKEAVKAQHRTKDEALLATIKSLSETSINIEDIVSAWESIRPLFQYNLSFIVMVIKLIREKNEYSDLTDEELREELEKLCNEKG